MNIHRASADERAQFAHALTLFADSEFAYELALCPEVLVAKQDGVMAGALGYRLDERLSIAFLQILYVYPSARSLGTGTKLLAAVERRARAAGCRSVELMSTPNAIPFYQRHGYTFMSVSFIDMEKRL